MCEYDKAYMQGFTDGMNTKYSLPTVEEILERMPGDPYVLGVLAGSRAATTTPMGQSLLFVQWNRHHCNGSICMHCRVPRMVQRALHTVPALHTIPPLPSVPHTIPP